MEIDWGWDKMEEPICGWPQSYKTQVLYKMPKNWITSKGEFGVDSCITDEIEFLIKNGIRTLNSCCGHSNKTPGTEPNVIVDEDSIPKMLELGYENQKVLCCGQTEMKEYFLLKWPVNHVSKKKWEGYKQL